MILNLKKKLFLKLLDFRTVIARMLGLDANSLAVADYEIISRIERVISSFNEGIVPVHIQPLPAVHLQQTASSCSHSAGAYNQILSTDMYSSTSSSNNEQHRSSPTKRHHHSHSHTHHVHERSPSPQRQYHHHHHHSRIESSTESRQVHRSKSPRKVTIDPNSY